MIVSVSRRCDIPRFNFAWFLERLGAGFVEVTNPFNALQKKKISLLPPSRTKAGEESAELFAFWTRDPKAILDNAEKLEEDGFAFFVMVSLTSYPELLEPNAPRADTVADSMRKLAQKISSARVIWRYDPVFLSNITDFEFHLANFSSLAYSLKGSVKRVIVSVYDEYPAAERRLSRMEKRTGAFKKLPHYAENPSGSKTLLPAVRNLLKELAHTARGEGMEMQSCCEEDLSDCGIKSGACIDGEYMARTFKINTRGMDTGQRPSCLCAKSVDIGSYGSCKAGCIYCYAAR